MTATTIESDMPTRQALAQFLVNEPLQGYNDGTSPEAWLKARGEFYGETKVQLQPGVVSHLAAGDKLKLHRSETPNATYDAFDKSLSREAAKAAGSSAEDLSGITRKRRSAPAVWRKSCRAASTNAVAWQS